MISPFREILFKYAKHLLWHPKFRASQVKEATIEKVLSLKFEGDKAKEERQEFLTLFFQTGVVCNAAQVRKLNELGIDHYKVTQSHMADMEDRMAALDAKVTALSEAKKEEDDRYETMHREVTASAEWRIRLLSLLQTAFDRLPPDARQALPSMEGLGGPLPLMDTTHEPPLIS